MSYLTQMAGLAFKNFVSAAAGIAVALALIRGIARRRADTVGNFWVDLVRASLYVLLPMSIVVAIFLMWQGVPQNLNDYTVVNGLDNFAQTIAQGPVASQIAIKQLGTNGGGFFNANSAHPFENPTALSNFVECLAILLIPAGLTYTFGRMVGNTKQGWALFTAMSVIFLVGVAIAYWAEAQANPALKGLGIDQAVGNLEGKEIRFGVPLSALWAVATTAASNGSVNAMHDSFNALGGLVTLANIQLGEVVFGGVGSGLAGMLFFALLAVFLAGLMVGRTPEYIGKKVQAYEVKMVALAILIFPATVLAFTGLAAVTDWGKQTLNNGGPHGFSEMLYAFSSASGEQRVGLRRPGRQQRLLQQRPRLRHAHRPLPDHHPHSGCGRLPGPQAAGAAQPGHLPHHERPLGGPPGGRSAHRRCADVLPGPGLGSHRRALPG